MNTEDMTYMKNINWVTILSLVILIAGIIFWIYWGMTYGVWLDIGIYSITIVFVLFGLFGLLLSFIKTEEE